MSSKRPVQGFGSFFQRSFSVQLRVSDSGDGRSPPAERTTVTGAAGSDTCGLYDICNYIIYIICNVCKLVKYVLYLSMVVFSVKNLG